MSLEDTRQVDFVAHQVGADLVLQVGFHGLSSESHPGKRIHILKILLVRSCVLRGSDQLTESRDLTGSSNHLKPRVNCF